MNRRDFLQTAAVAAVGASARGAAPSRDGDLSKFVITKITGFRHVCPRPKFVGKNSHLGDHGDTTAEDVLRIETDQGVEGIGIGSAKPDVARRLLGKRLSEFWNPGIGAVSPLARADHALFDLVGKALGVPSWKLLGDAGPEWVPIYDGSIYFNDLRPGNESKGVRVLLDEVQSSLDHGHRAFKIKVGRGYKWMEKSAGFQRDVDVVRSIRQLAGRDVKLMVDANNGFDLESTMRWLDAVDDELLFVEEMFPEDVEQDRRLKRYLREKGWKTLVADGESAGAVEHFDALLDADAIDVVQPDIRGFGLTMQWAMSRRIASNPRVKLAPHNWGSFLGVYMQAILARGIPNFLMAEQDPATSDLFDVSAFEFKEGKMRVPDSPGCGLAIREDVFKQKYAKAAWTVAAGD